MLQVNAVAAPILIGIWLAERPEDELVVGLVFGEPVQQRHGRNAALASLVIERRLVAAQADGKAQLGKIIQDVISRECA